MFFTKTLWNDRYFGGGEVLPPLSGAAEMQNKPPFNKCLRHCILQCSYVVVVPQDISFFISIPTDFILQAFTLVSGSNR